MSSTISLPFEFTNKSISRWLSQLNSSDIMMSNEVYAVLSALKKKHKNIDSESLAVVVMRLTPVVIHLSASLEKTIIKHTQGNKVAQLSTRLLEHLVFLHVYLSRKTDLQKESVLHLNYAVQIAGVIFKHYALSYQRPSTNLWKYMSEGYEFASNEGMLTTTVKTPIAELQALSTVSTALKRLLLFWIANPFCLNQQDIVSLFDFCTQNCSLVNIVEQGISVKHAFCWEYGMSGSCQPVFTRPAKLKDRLVLFNTHALIRSEYIRSLNIENLELLIARFDQYRYLLESTKFALSRSYVFASGFENLESFFCRHVRQQQILVLNTPTPKNLNFSTLELVKEKQKNTFVIEQVSSADIWNLEKEIEETVKLKFGAMKLVQTSLSLLFIAETMEVKLVADDLFICYDTGLKPVLGITRLAELNQRGAIQKSVVELCIGQVSLLQQTQAGTNIKALLIENETQYELFLSSDNLEIGNVLKFDQVEIVLERLLELSTKFMRYIVSVRDLGV